MATIRGVRADDLDALYHISLKTGDAGQDATALYEDPKLVGHIYSAPYAVLAPEAAFVVEDAQGAAGYIVGAASMRGSKRNGGRGCGLTMPIRRARRTRHGTPISFARI